MQLWTGCMVAVALLGLAEPDSDVLRLRLEASAPGKGSEGRLAAIEKAKQEAVLQVVKSVTASDDILKFRPILDNASDYVQSYHVLEQARKDDLTELKLEAFVMEKKLKHDLADLVLPLFPRPPRVVVAVAEEGSEGRSAYADAIEGCIAQALTDAGLEVVKPTEVKARCSGAEAVARIKGEAETAVRYAWENLADVAIVGQLAVATEPTHEGSNIGLNRASLVVRIIRGDDARTFDAQTAEAVVNSREPDEGRTMAVADVGEKVKENVLVAAVLAAAGAKATPYVVLTIEGLKEATQMDELAARAKECPGVEDAETLHYGADAARMRIKYAGSVGPLVDTLTETPYSSFRLIPRQVIDRDMTLAVKQ